jgi:hypothetical protein
MRKIDRAEVLGLAEYERIRDHFRARVIEEKKRRRLVLGDRASCVFENRDTVLLQIQEMLRTERITREASVQHEIDTYNGLIPDTDELSATVMIEIEEKTERDRFLVEAKGLDRAFALVVDGTRCPGKNDESRENEDRTTAVHYLKFALGDTARVLREVAEKKRAADSLTVELLIEHPRYNARAKLPLEHVAALAEDLL